MASDSKTESTETGLTEIELTEMSKKIELTETGLTETDLTETGFTRSEVIETGAIDTDFTDTGVIGTAAIRVVGPRDCNILSINTYSRLSFLYKPVQQLREVGGNGSISFTCIGLILFVLTKVIIVGYNLYHGLKIWDDVSMGAVRNIANNSDGLFWRIFVAILIIPGSYQFILFILNFAMLCIQVEEEMQWMLPVIFIVVGLYGNMIAAVISNDLYTVGPSHCVAAINGALIVDAFWNDRIHLRRAGLTLAGEFFLIIIYEFHVQEPWWTELLSTVMGILLMTAYRTSYPATYNFTVLGRRINKFGLRLACILVALLLFLCNLIAMLMTYKHPVASLSL